MKKNSITYLLLIVVVVVWGVVFYNLFNPSDKNKVEQVTSLVSARKNENKRTKLSLNYRNPFRAVTVETKVEPEAQPVEIKKEEPPTFNYKGFINGEKQKVIIIEKSGRSEVISVKDSLFGFKIISLNNDSIVVRKNKTRYSLLKN